MTKIIIIDDEQDLRDEVTSWLQFEGFECFEAPDGEIGLQLIFQQVPDLILCDIMMPKLDGYNVLYEVQANPTTSRIPFVFISARADYEGLRRGMNLGADDYLIKPFTREDLLQAIHVRLHKKLNDDAELRRQIAFIENALAHEHEQHILKSRVIAMFSHDFRTPLANILSSNSMLNDYMDRMDQNRRKLHISRIESSVRQMLQMIDDLLLTAQIESGKFHFTLQMTDVTRFVRELIEDFQYIHQDTHLLVFESQLTEPMPLEPKLIRQIISNLVSNAIKYSPSGKEVRIELTRELNTLKLTVTDQGIGIPLQDQPHLFEMFHRASNVGQIHGTGIGLAIVKQAVDLHHGTIEFTSQTGIGTIFTVMIPIPIK